VAVGLCGIVHSAPLVGVHGGIRRRFLPALAGMGLLDRVALTFDDGPDPVATPRILEALDDLSWRATFFMLGDMVRRSPDVVSDLVAAGHEVALHGDHHRAHIWRTPNDVAEDMRRSHALLARVSGQQIRWFRPPHGYLTATSWLTARELGLRTVLWTTWGRDWTADATPQSVFANLKSALEPGATLLLHDSDCTTAPRAWEAALGALPLLAEELASRGLAVVPLCEHHAA
jgi:peptidoglycan/xylan/chitin deacetylase (PgdA/CDA1 family)